MIDTSALIEIKDTVPARGGQLWETLAEMLELVKGGVLTFPSQVEAELLVYPTNDSISVWCAAAKKHRAHRDPDYATVRTIQRDPTVSKLCDWAHDLGDPADPYVVAQAFELMELDLFPEVVCEDRRDKLDSFGKVKKASMVSACRVMGIPVVSSADFLSGLSRSQDSALS